MDRFGLTQEGFVGAWVDLGSGGLKYKGLGGCSRFRCSVKY